MTNKEKYPNAKIDANLTVGCDIKGHFFIKLKDNVFLLYDGSIGPHSSINPNNTYYKTRQEAQQALDNFMKEEKQITLQEIKNLLTEAKKLIGKNVEELNSGRHPVEKVELVVHECESSYYCDEFFKKHGYVIKVSSDGFSIPYTPDIKPFKKAVKVKAHDGVEYKAEDREKYWKFGCARISKQLIQKAYDLFDTKFADGNREVKKITIGACDFDFDTLKQLVELDKK